MAIDSRTVREIAALANLDLTDQECERLRHQLEAILDFMADLRAVDVSGTPPMSHAPLEGRPLRDDVVRPSLEVERALTNAPDPAEGHFRVPQVLRT